MRINEEYCFKKKEKLKKVKNEEEYQRQEEANGENLSEKERQIEAKRRRRRRTSALVDMKTTVASEEMPLLLPQMGGSSRSSTTTSTTNLAPSPQASNCFLRHNHPRIHRRCSRRLDHASADDQLVVDQSCTWPSCCFEHQEQDNHCDSKERDNNDDNGKDVPVVPYCRCNLRGKIVAKEQEAEEAEEAAEVSHERCPLFSFYLATQLGRDQKGEETEKVEEVKFESGQCRKYQELASAACGQVGPADLTKKRTQTESSNAGPIDESSRWDELTRAPQASFEVETNTSTSKTTDSLEQRQDIDNISEDNGKSHCQTTTARQMLVKSSRTRRRRHESVSRISLEFNHRRRPIKQLLQVQQLQQQHKHKQANVLIVLFVYSIVSIVSNSSLLISLFHSNNNLVDSFHCGPVTSAVSCDNSLSIGASSEGSEGWRPASVASRTTTMSRPSSASFVVFASAEVHSGSAKSRPSKPSAEQQQDRRQQTTTTTTDYKLNVTVEDDNDESVERFKLRSSGQIVIAEGTRVPLWCKVKSRSAVSWLKDQFPFFDDEMIKVDHTAKRFNFIGNITENDYSIELVNAQEADSGKYWCQISPYGERSSKKKSGASNNSEFIAETILTVTPAPVQTLSPIAANSLTTADQNGSGDHTSSQQHGHYISPLSQTSSSSSTSDNNLIGSSNYLDSFSSSKSTVNNNKAREAVPNTAIKLSNGYLSPAPYNYNQHHHSTVRASTIPTNSPGLLGGNGSGAGMHSVALIWPYLLLVLAALLMLANVYLIFSLIKRHTRCSKEDEANEEHDNDDPSLA